MERNYEEEAVKLICAEVKHATETLNPYLDSIYTIAVRETAARLKAEAEMQGVLDNIPKDMVVHVREGAGTGDIAASLAVSVAKMAHALRNLPRLMPAIKAPGFALDESEENV